MLVTYKRSLLREDTMDDQQQDKDETLIGDKVRIRSGPYAKKKGVVHTKAGELLEIHLDEGPLIHVEPSELTNYSLAARRAWQTMPKQSGRHQLAVPRKRMVSLRLDIDVLDDLDRATESGLIPNKEQAVNNWLRQQLDSLFQEEHSSDTARE